MRMTVCMTGLYGRTTIARSRLSQRALAVFKDPIGNTMQKLELIGLSLVISCLIQAASSESTVPARVSNDSATVHFEAQVRPILLARCDECHGDTADGGLRLDSREALLKGGESGPAIVVGNPDSSLLIQAIRHTRPNLHMPRKRRQLAPEEIQQIVLDVLFEHHEIEEQNDVIRAKALTGTKTKKPAKLPNEFVTRAVSRFRL